MRIKLFKSALSLLLVLLLCVSVMAPSFAAAELDGNSEIAPTGDDLPVVEWHANNNTSPPSATVRESDVQAVFAELGIGTGTYYGIKAKSASGNPTNLSSILSSSTTVNAGAYTIYRTTAIFGSPIWGSATTQDITVRLYYTASFDVNGADEGAIYLDGEEVSGEVKLYTDTEYTVTAEPVEGYTYTISGAEEGAAFTPSADTTITAEYIPDERASVSLDVTGDGTAQVLVNGEETNGVLPVGASFTVETAPNTDKGYALDSIVVTKNGEEIKPNQDGSYGPAENGDEFAVSVTFIYDPEVVNYEVSASSPRLRSADFNTMFGESGTRSYGYASVNNPNSISTLSNINGANFAAGEYYIYSTSYSLLNPNWANGKVKKMVLRTYYTGTFSVTGHEDGAVYLNDEAVDGSAKLYTDTEYTVTAKEVEEYSYTISGAEDGVAFTPSANVNITVSYLKTAFATYELTVGEGGTAEVLVNGEPPTDRISEGDSFTVTATPNENAGYKLGSIVVTKNGEEIEANEDGSYGPAEDQAVYEITVTFTYDPPRADIEIDANEGRVTLSNISGFFGGSYSYYGIAEEVTDEPTYLNVLNQNYNVQAGEYFIYGTDDGNAFSPDFTNAKLMILTVRTYYNGTFSVTGNDDGEVYLNGEAVGDSAKLYTDTEYTVTAKAIDGYEYEMTGAEDGAAFTPSADVNVTVTYTNLAYATLSLNVGEGGTAQVLVNGEAATDRISEGDIFTIEATPNTDRGYKIESIVVTRNGEEIESGDGAYGPVADGEEYTVTVTFVFDPERVAIEVDANEGRVTRSDIRGFFEGSYNYFGIAKEATDDITYLYNLVGYENGFGVTNGEYIIYATNDNNGGLVPQPIWDNAKLMILTVRTYYNGSFSVTGHEDGAVYLNGEAVNGSVRLYTDTEYTITVDEVEKYDCTVSGAQTDVAFTPSANVNVTVAYTKKTYTVTWENWDGTELLVDTVEIDATPEYTGDTPTRESTAEYEYSFAGWSPDIEPVTGDVTYTATFTEVPRSDFFTGHSITLTGDIGVNFYLDLNDHDIAEGAVVDFTWTVNGSQKSHAATLTSADETDSGYKASCPIAVAEMTYEITATLTIDETVVETNTYSAATYANIILTNDDFKEEYIRQTSEEKYDQLVTLVKTMLDYGSKAQIRFDRNTDILANGGEDFFTGEVDMTSGASNMDEYLDDCGLEYVGTSVIYLSETTLRHYYKIVDASKFTEEVKSGITFDGETVTYGERSGMIYFDKKDIAASQLDTEYVLSLGGHDYHYSALDYSALSYGSDDKPYSDSIAKQLAASVYRYNQAANVFFND